jgi:nucleoside-diphosphate-sugar epimerase
MEAARQSNRGVKSVVVASSDKAYGSSDQLPYLENFPLHGDGPYDVSKSCTDLIAQSYGSTYGVPATIARCGYPKILFESNSQTNTALFDYLREVLGYQIVKVSGFFNMYLAER